MSFSRRKFLSSAGAGTAAALVVSPLDLFYSRVAHGMSTRGAAFGRLRPVLPLNTYELPEMYRGVPFLELAPGFNYTALSLEGMTMTDGNPVPADHDGMAAFAGSGNSVILVRNHELSPGELPEILGTPKYDPVCSGGTTNVVVAPNGRVIRDYATLAGTIRNCAGGPTPWGSWISCEENVSVPNGFITKKHGYNFEVPASAEGLVDPVPLIDMGRFNHEAVAVDPATGYVYQTEDRGDSCFYRFIPNVPGELAAGGELQAMVILDGDSDTRRGYLGLKGVALPVSWVTIDDPDPDTDTVRDEARGKGAAIFARGEGAWYGNGLVYFVATSGGDIGEGQVWAYNPADETVMLVVESEDRSELDNPDNITVGPDGSLYLCEDGGGEQFVVRVGLDGTLSQFARNAIPADSGLPTNSEFCGACFSPDGQKLFVNIQSPGVTLCIRGPWARLR